MEKAEKKGLFGLEGVTLKTLVTAIILATVVSGIGNWTRGVLHNHTWILATRVAVQPEPPTGSFMMVLLISGIIAAAIGRKYNFSAQEMAIFVSIVFITVESPFLIQQIVATMTLDFYWESTIPVRKYMPSWWGVSDRSVIEGAYLGNSPVPWGALFPSMMAWTFFAIMFLLTQLFTMAVFRKKFLEIDKVPFPHMVPATEIIRLGTEYETPESKYPRIFGFRKLKYFWFGWLVGLFVAAPLTINYWFPFFPVFHCWGQVYMDRWINPWLEGLNLHLTGVWILSPADIAVMYFAPMDILITIVLFDFVSYFLYPIIGTLTGYMKPGVSPWSYWMGEEGWAFMPGNFGISLGGIYIGLALWVIISGWRPLTQSLGNAIRRVKPSEGDIPDSWAWFGFIITWLLMIAFWLASGMGPIIFWAVFLTILLLLGHTYIWGENPGGYFGEQPWSWPLRQGVRLPFGSISATQEAAVTGAYLSAIGNPLWECTPAGGWAYMSVFKLAETTKTPQKSMLVGTAIGLTIWAILAVPMGLWTTYAWGNTRLTWYMGGVASDMPEGVVNPFTFWSPAYNAWFVIGVVTSLSMMFIRLRYPGFFLHPAGFVGIYPGWEGVIGALPALILKYITLKVGGAKGYDNVGVPAVAGFMIGLTFWATIGMIGLHIRSLM